MFNSSTLRNVMSALLLAVVISAFAPMANACDGKTDRLVKTVRPLSAIVRGIKNLLGGNSKSPNQEPSTGDSDYVTDDASELMIGS